jgi:hypothetical protein
MKTISKYVGPSGATWDWQCTPAENSSGACEASCGNSTTNERSSNILPARLRFAHPSNRLASATTNSGQSHGPTWAKFPPTTVSKILVGFVFKRNPIVGQQLIMPRQFLKKPHQKT